VAATDASGTLLWREEYAPYGERLTQEPASSENTAWYTGKQEETTFGISYFGARWYDPAIGRFMAVDPVGFNPDNTNSFSKYAYANNNPYLYVDPDGKAATLVLTGIGAGTILIIGYALMPNHEQAVDSLIQGWKALTEGSGDDGTNDTSDSSGDNNDKQSDDSGQSQKARQKGDRFKTGDDVLQQHDEVESAQRNYRKGKGKKRIDSIEKSRQRVKNFLKDYTKGNPSGSGE
jgi:RHS repeat-associated protein